MDCDNIGQRLPTGYGRRFDYARGQQIYSLYVPGIFPYFHLVRKMEFSVEIEEWYDKIKQNLMAKKYEMVPIREGINGTYFCKDRSGEYVAVFKPFDEEDMAPYNPKSDDSLTGPTEASTGPIHSSDPETHDSATFSTGPIVGSAGPLHGTNPKTDDSAGPIVGSTGPIPGTKIGKGAAREVAAYLLDHPAASKRREGFTGEIEGFCGVPPTLPITGMHDAMNYQARPGSGLTTFDGHVKYYKYGSLQKYMENDGHCSESDSEGLAVDLVHKICLLDIRYANADRHFKNILFKKAEDNGSVKLIPIDHGYCFPENFKACRFDWLRIWKDPTREHFNSEAIGYIESLDSKKDIDLLIRNHFTMSYTFARSLRISTRLLKEGVKRGLTPFEIGHFMCDEPPIKGSDDEVDRIVHEACSKLLGQSNDRNESVLQMILCEAIKELVRKYLGKESVNDEEIIRKVEKESKLEGLNMTKQEVETELLDIVFQKMEEELDQYAKALQPLRK